MQTVFIKCVCTFFGGGGGGILIVGATDSCARSWLKDHLITLPVLMLQILIFAKKEVRFITSIHYLVIPKHWPSSSPLQLLSRHGEAQAFSDYTAFFCSPVPIWFYSVTGVEVSYCVTCHSSLQNGYPSPFIS